MECRVCAQEGAFQLLWVLPAPHQHLDPTPCVCVYVCVCVGGGSSQLLISTWTPSPLCWGRGVFLPAPPQHLDPNPYVCVVGDGGGGSWSSRLLTSTWTPPSVCVWVGEVALPAPHQHLDPSEAEPSRSPRTPEVTIQLACPGPRVQAGLLERSEGRGPWPGKGHTPRTPKKPGQIFANTSKQQNSHQSNLEWSPQIQVCVHTSVSCTCAFVQRDTYRQTRRMFCPWLLGISSFLSLAAPPQSTF